MSYEIISADTHLDITWLPGDMFVEGAPANMKSRMPRVKDTDAGPRWMVEDTDVAGVGGGGLTGNFSKYVRGQSKLLDKMDDVGFFSGIDEGIYHPSDVDLRIKDQEIDGIDAEVMYGILAIGGGAFSIPGFQDPAVLATVYDVYNAWVGDFVKANPQRLAALGCLSVHDPEDAARQLRFAADSGLRGAEINVKKMTKPMYHGAWDPLWAASEELGMPVSFHALGLELRAPDPEDEAEYGPVHHGMSTVTFQLSGAEIVLAVVLSGACERYPGFKFVLGECGIGWIPYVVERMDMEYEDKFFRLGLNLKPSEYWRRQGFSTFQYEYVSMDQVNRIGVDSIMWGSDYPHPDGVFPESRKVIEETLGHLEPEVFRKIVCENAANLYGFN